MHEWHNSFMILLLYAMTGSQSVTGQVLKQGCIGESIQIKENITYNIKNIMHISIFKTEGGTIGMWHINGSIPFITNGYSKRVVLDRNGNIWITNLAESDSDTYSIRTDMEGLKPNIEKVKLKVLVPPTKNCTPKITRNDNLLITDLRKMNNKECGDPPVEAYWLNHPENFITEKVIKIQPGNDNGIFHACIKGDSLTCAKMSYATEYCSIYKDSTHVIREALPESSTTATYTFPSTSSTLSPSDIVIIIIAVILSACVICVIFICVKMKTTLCTKRQKEKENELFITEDNIGSARQTDGTVGRIDSSIPYKNVTSKKVPSLGAGNGETVNNGIKQEEIEPFITKDKIGSARQTNIGDIPGVQRNMKTGPISLKNGHDS